MVVAAYLPYAARKTRNKFGERYPALFPGSNYEDSIFVLFNSANGVVNIPEGISRWGIDLQCPIENNNVRIDLRVKQGFTQDGNKFATAVCSPEGVLGVGQLFGSDHFLVRDQAVSIRAYQCSHEIRYTIKEYLVRDIADEQINMEVNVVRGSFGRVLWDYPHYRVAMVHAWRTLASFS